MVWLVFDKWRCYLLCLMVFHHISPFTISMLAEELNLLIYPKVIYVVGSCLLVSQM